MKTPHTVPNAELMHLSTLWARWNSASGNPTHRAIARVAHSCTIAQLRHMLTERGIAVD